jgi:hypothetical protein
VRSVRNERMPLHALVTLRGSCGGCTRCLLRATRESGVGAGVMSLRSLHSFAGEGWSDY